MLQDTSRTAVHASASSMFMLLALPLLFALISFEPHVPEVRMPKALRNRWV